MSTKAEGMIACCSFCVKPNTEVTKLVAGPGVYICNECVSLCVEIIGQPTDSTPGLAPWDHAGTIDEVLVNLSRVADSVAQVEGGLAQWVGRARSLGATWRQIGDALGMTRQSAWERFAGEE